MSGWETAWGEGQGRPPLGLSAPSAVTFPQPLPQSAWPFTREGKSHQLTRANGANPGGIQLRSHGSKNQVSEALVYQSNNYHQIMWAFQNLTFNKCTLCFEKFFKFNTLSYPLYKFFITKKNSIQNLDIILLNNVIVCGPSNKRMKYKIIIFLGIS